MQSSRMEGGSKLEVLLNQINNGYVKQQIVHSHCSCQMCVNDVKPIPTPQQSRQTYPNQINIPASQSLLYVLKKCINYRGVIIIPQVIFLQQGMLFYTNQYGKLRMRDKLTNQEAKKFFDQRKAKTKFIKTLDKQKDNYVLVYKSGTQQLMTQTHFNKIIVKRKNDPFWLEVVYSYKLPQSRQGQNFIKSYNYKRTKSGTTKMIKIMEKIMYQIDNQQQKLLNKEEGLKNVSTLTVDQNMLNSMQNSINLPNNPSQTTPFNKIPLQQSFLLQKQMTSTIYKAQHRSRLKGYSIKTMIQEIVAYLQVATKTRILQIQIQYIQPQMQPIITSITKLIVCEVPSEQECYLHDRYRPLQVIGIKELTQLKKKLDSKDQQTLWNVCTDILNSCLQVRKIKLKIQNYQKPSRQNLKLIFQKFFPDFSPSEMFQGVNWKNQLPKFMQDSRKAINKIIQEDQGISVLKRYNIVFYRTFR